MNARVPAGVPTGGQFSTTSRPEAQISLGAGDSWGALSEAVEQIRREAYAAGQADAYAKAADLVTEFDGPIAAVHGHEVQFTDGGSMRLHDTVTEAIAIKALTAAGESLRAYATGGFTDETDAYVRRDQEEQDKSTPLGRDRVEVDGYGTFERRREGVYPGVPYAIRFEANRALSDNEMRQMAQVIGYNYAATVRGEPMDLPERDSTHSFVVGADTTKARSDDLGVALEDFEKNLDEYLLHGSPIRTTNRAGRGTQGTRLVTGLGDPDLKVEIYYDDVETATGHAIPA